MRRLSISVGLVLAVGLVAGCGLLPTAAAPPTPCAQVLIAVRCLVMTDTAALNLGLKREDIMAIDILPDPPPPDGVLVTRSGGPDIDVRVTLVDGSARETQMGCVGVAEDWNPACQADPHVTIRSIIDGYRDVPAGSSPVPKAAADALTNAEALRMSSLDIPIDHVGRYEVSIGEARLPNGILTVAEFALAERWPAHLTIIDMGGVMLEIRSLEPDGKPFQNYYLHGWRRGTERVEAVLVFNVFRFDPGARLAIRDVLVQ